MRMKGALTAALLAVVTPTSLFVAAPTVHHAALKATARAAWATMSAAQIGRHQQVRGGVVPFGGTDVRRLAAPVAPSVIPEGARVTAMGRFDRQWFRVADAWSGLLLGRRFVLDVYTRLGGGGVVDGVWYDARLTTAYRLTAGRDYVLRGFTGSFVVFAVPSVNGSYSVVNVRTGAWLTERNENVLVQEMAGCFPCQPAAGADWITGLGRRYPFRPGSQGANHRTARAGGDTGELSQDGVHRS